VIDLVVLFFVSCVMSWIYLIIAGIFEIGWPIGIKMAQGDGNKVQGFVIAALFMSLSGYFLFLAQKTIPLGTAYAVWTGIGAAGTFLAGIYLYNDPAKFLNYLGIFLIVSGVAVLKIASR
jgi:quaternary ammonium compound-resistance protein SugE